MRFLRSAIAALPAAAWARSYRVGDLNVDLVAGLSLAAFVIPESLAYASLAQLPPVTGLYCYLVAGIAYALFGTSRQLAVGPTSALAIVIAAGVATISGDPSRFVALASAIALMVGLIGIGGRYIGLANAAYFISEPVLIGFKTGAALYIASTQLPKLFGIEGVAGNFFERVAHVVVSLPHVHPASLIFGVAAIGLFVLLDRMLPGRPTTLFVVIAAIVVTSVFHLDATGMKIVGELPLGLPDIGIPEVDLADVSALLPLALACFVLAYSESISAARAFAQKHGYEIKPEQELTALGAANLATGMAQGFPVGGGMSQTAVNDVGGASSPAALVFTSGAIALTLLFFAGFFHNLPEPVLGAVVLMAASHLIRIEDLRRVHHVSRTEFLIALLALGGVLLLGLLDGLLLAAAGSLVMVVAHASRPPVVTLGHDDKSGIFVSQARYPESRDIPGVLIVRNAGAWLYFNAANISGRMNELVAGVSRDVKILVLDLSIVSMFDVTGATVLCGFARSLGKRGIALELAELRDDVADTLKAIDTQHDLGSITAHRTIEDCLGRATQRDMEPMRQPMT